MKYYIALFSLLFQGVQDPRQRYLPHTRSSFLSFYDFLDIPVKNIIRSVFRNPFLNRRMLIFAVLSCLALVDSLEAQIGPGAPPPLTIISPENLPQPEPIPDATRILLESLGYKMQSGTVGIRAEVTASEESRNPQGPLTQFEIIETQVVIFSTDPNFNIDDLQRDPAFDPSSTVFGSGRILLIGGTKGMSLNPLREPAVFSGSNLGLVNTLRRGTVDYIEVGINSRITDFMATGDHKVVGFDGMSIASQEVGNPGSPWFTTPNINIPGFEFDIPFTDNLEGVAQTYTVQNLEPLATFDAAPGLATAFGAPFKLVNTNVIRAFEAAEAYDTQAYSQLIKNASLGLFSGIQLYAVTAPSSPPTLRIAAGLTLLAFGGDLALTFEKSQEETTLKFNRVLDGLYQLGVLSDMPSEQFVRFNFRTLSYEGDNIFPIGNALREEQIPFTGHVPFRKQTTGKIPIGSKSGTATTTFSFAGPVLNVYDPDNLNTVVSSFPVADNSIFIPGPDLDLDRVTFGIASDVAFPEIDGQFEGSNFINSHEFTFTDFSDVPGLPDDGGAVDFTNINLAGLNFDAAQKTVEFIATGTPVAGGTNDQLFADAELLQRVFFQALSIPNIHHWVSLDIINGQGQANAGSEALKRTDIGDIFFTADEQMKHDLYAELIAQGDELYQLWLEIFVNDENEAEKQLFIDMANTKGLWFPDVARMRGVITPEIPEGTSGRSSTFIENASYKVNHFVDFVAYDMNGAYVVTTLEGMGINGVFQYWGALLDSNVGGVINPGGTLAFTLEELTFLQTKTQEYITTLYERLGIAANRVSGFINSGSKPEYEKISKILPALISAQWYKQLNDDQKQYALAIDGCNNCEMGNYGLDHFGVDLSQDFNQTEWDQMAFQIIATEQIDLAQVGLEIAGPQEPITMLTTEIKGGVDNDSTHFENLYLRAPDSGQNFVSDMLEEFPAVENAGDYYVTLPSLNTVDLPELSIRKFALSSRSNNPELGDFEEGLLMQVSVEVVNTSNVPAGGRITDFLGLSLVETTPLSIIFRELFTNGELGPEYFAVLESDMGVIAPYSVSNQSFTIRLPNAGTYLVYADLNGAVPFEGPIQDGQIVGRYFSGPAEFTRSNNRLGKIITILPKSENPTAFDHRYLSLGDNDTTATIDSDFDVMTGYFRSENVNIAAEVSADIRAKHRITLKGGFHVERGSSSVFKIDNGSDYFHRVTEKLLSQSRSDGNGLPGSANMQNFSRSNDSKNSWNHPINIHTLQRLEAPLIKESKTIEDPWKAYKEALFTIKPFQKPVTDEATSEFLETPGVILEDVLLYPNPAKVATRVIFELEAPAVVSISLHGPTGDVLKTITSHEELEAGRHERQLDVRGFSNGVYFVRLVTSEGLTVVKRLVKH